MKPLSLALIVARFALAVAQQPAQFVVTPQKLVGGSEGISAVHDGKDFIYILGGWETTVWRYSLSKRVIEAAGQFPPGLSGGSAVYTGNAPGDIWYFGGRSRSGTTSADINVFSTAASTTFKAQGTLPYGMINLGTAWDATNKVAYLFGGSSPPAYLDTAYSYDGIAVDNVATVGSGGIDPGATIWVPAPTGGAGAGSAFVFGGDGGPSNPRDLIYQYTPPSRYVALLTAKLPVPTFRSCAVLVGSDVYITGNSALVKFDTVSQTASAVPVSNYPSYLYQHTCSYVASQGRIYMFGGFGDFGTGLKWRDEVYYIDLGLPPPTTTTTTTTTTAKPTTTTTTTIRPPPPPDCNDGTTKLIQYPGCCDTFIFCNQRVGKKYPCPSGQQFNPVTATCEDSVKVKCANTYGV